MARQPDERAHRASPTSATPSLSTLVENISSGLVEVVRAPKGLEVAVGEFVIYDATEETEVEQGDLVLAVGIDPSSRAALELVSRAGAKRASGVLVKGDVSSLPEALLAAAEEAKVALMVAPREAVWGQLHALFRSARTASGVAGEIGPGGAPIGDLFALANAVATMVGAATTIEDPRSTVLAYSSTDEPIDPPRQETILGRRVPDEWLERLRADGVFRKLWSEGFIRVDYRAMDPDFLPRIAVAVTAGSEILGSIWAVEGRKPLDVEAEAALREASRVAALHLLRHRAGDDLERQRRADLLRAVLDGRMSTSAFGAALEVPVDAMVTVVALELPIVEGEPAHRSHLAERAISAISLHCDAYRRQAMAMAEGRVLYLMLPDAVVPAPERMRAFVLTAVERLGEAFSAEPRAAIGPTVDGLTGLAEAKRGAEMALRAMVDAGVTGVADAEQLRSRTVLLELRDLAAQHPSLRIGKLDRLVEHDRQRRSEYLTTLRAYFDTFGDVNRAAAMVSVHPNTFRYRLRRLLEAADIDLDDPVERLIVHLQLSLVDTDIPDDWQ